MKLLHLLPAVGLLVLTATAPRPAAAQNAPAWAQAIECRSNIVLDYVACDAASNTYTAGYVRDTARLGSFRVVPGGLLGNSGQYLFNGFVAKLDAQGSAQWLQTLAAPGSGTEAFVAGLTVDAAGNSLLCGGYRNGPLTLGSTTLPANAIDVNKMQGVVAKLDPAGYVLWAERVGGSGGNSIFLNGIAQSATGTVYVGISFDPTASTADSGLGIVSFNSNGGLRYFYNFPGVSRLPGSPYGPFGAIKRLEVNPTTGQVGVIGDFFGTLTLRNAGSAGPAIAFTSPPEPQRGAFVAGLDPATGAVQWAQEQTSTGISTGGNSRSYANRLTGLAVAGAGFATMGVYLGTGTLAGQPLPASGIDTSRVVLARFDGQGQLLGRSILSSDGDPDSQLLGVALSTDAAGDLHLSGSFTGAMSAGSGGLRSSGPAGTYDGFVVRYSGQGQRLGQQAVGGAGSKSISALALDGTGQPRIAGTYSFVATIGSQPVPASVGRFANGYIARLARTPLAVRVAGPAASALQAYPNPARPEPPCRCASPPVQPRKRYACSTYWGKPCSRKPWLRAPTRPCCPPPGWPRAATCSRP